jgi:hypothetical protein
MLHTLLILVSDSMRMKPGTKLNSYQVSRRLFPRISACTSGFILQKLMGKEYERGISRPSLDRKSPILMMWGPERLQRASKLTLVSHTGLFKCEWSKSPFSEIDLVQMGISEKVTIAITCFSSFIIGFIIAYARSWRLAFALSSMIVCMAFIGGAMKKFLSKYTQ